MKNIFSATYGPVYGSDTTTGPYTFYATIDQNSQDYQANTSNITVKLEMSCATSGRKWTANAAVNQPHGKISGDLSKTGNGMSSYDGPTRVTIVSYTKDVPHEADGTKTISETFSWIAGALGYYPASFTVATATNVALDPIPRMSTVAISNALISSAIGNLSYTVTSAASFYHKLDLNFNGNSSNLLNGQLINGTYTGTIPYSDLLTWLGSDTSATLELVLSTYNDSGMLSLVGTTSAQATIVNGMLAPTSDFIRGSMYPKLFPADATDFSTNGITTLADTVKCEITEERNGAFELEMVVATTTPYFDQIQVGCLVVAKPNHTQGPQAFEIYEITKPINQKVTIRAHHVSYRASYIPVLPFTATGITNAIIGLNANALEYSPFIISTDITNEESTYNQSAPASFRSRLGGSEGSLLDTFGGEFLWDNWNISLRKNRGADNGVQLRLGKNILALNQTLNIENVVTGALPVWSDGTSTVYGDVQHSPSADDYAYARTVILDLSDKYDSEPTVGQLNQAANTYINKAGYATPNNNIKISFVDLADTIEYKDSMMERVNLCDTVEVIYEALDISYKAKVIKIRYDALSDRTLEAEVGQPRQTLAQAINGVVDTDSSGGGSGGGGGGGTGKFYGQFVGELMQTDSGGTEQVVVQQSGSDDIEVNAIGGSLLLGNSNTAGLAILGFYKMLTTGFTGMMDGDATNANDLIPKTGSTIKAGDMGFYLSTSSTGRSNWPSTTQRGILFSIALTDNGTYAVQFGYMNTQTYLYQRIKNNGTWSAWRKVTFS